jgi:hypothetical protein
MCAWGNLRGSSKRVWQILLCLTLFALLFRAAFPVGYMPKLSSHGSDSLTVSLCTEYDDTSLVPVNFHGGAPDHDGMAQHCPFCAVVSQAVMPGTAVLAVVTAATHEIPLILPDGIAARSTLTVGSPLGSRAPPTLLG